MTGGGSPKCPPLVLLPGTLCDELLWKHQARHLAGVVAPRVYDISRDNSIEAIAGRVLKEAPSRFLLAGLSMGGIVAFEIMRRAPERVIALALLDTNPALPDLQQVELWRGEIVLAQGGSFAHLVEERWIPSLMEAGGSGAGGLRATIRVMAHAIGPEGFVRQIVAQMARKDSWASLSRISCPTLVLGGRDDSMCTPVVHEAMAATIPNARLAIIEDCGHLSALEQPGAVTALLHAWLKSTRKHDAPAYSASMGGHRA